MLILQFGGAPAELFQASVNDRYASPKFRFQMGDGGYTLWTITGVYYNVYYEDDLYFIRSSKYNNSDNDDYTPGYWLAAPSGDKASGGYWDDVWYVEEDGFSNNNDYNGRLNGIRPVVCLKKGVQLVKGLDNVFEIK